MDEIKEQVLWDRIYALEKELAIQKERTSKAQKEQHRAESSERYCDGQLVMLLELFNKQNSDTCDCKATPSMENE